MKITRRPIGELKTTTIMLSTKEVGKGSYEASLIDCPNYHDGTKRKTWDELREFEKSTWNDSRAIAA